MDGENSVNLAHVDAQFDQFIRLYREVKAENAQLKRQLRELEDCRVGLEIQLKDLRANYERLKLAKMFGCSEESKRQANERISRLVREIDQCLALLDE